MAIRQENYPNGCKVEDCGKPVKGRGLCNAHYLREQRHGNPTAGGTFRERINSDVPPQDRLRFWNYIEVTETCWPWIGCRNREGYGHIGHHSAHRLVYEALRGPIPRGLTIDHLCHTHDLSCAGGKSCLHRRCVNPNHLEAVTLEENSRRAGGRKTACPEGHPYDTRVERRGGVERRCSVCINAQRRERIALAGRLATIKAEFGARDEQLFADSDALLAQGIPLGTAATQLGVTRGALKGARNRVTQRRRADLVCPGDVELLAVFAYSEEVRQWGTSNGSIVTPFGRISDVVIASFLASEEHRDTADRVAERLEVDVNTLHQYRVRVRERAAASAAS